MDYLIATSSPNQTGIRNFGNKLSINQDVNELDNGKLILRQFIQKVASPTPDIFTGTFVSYSGHQRKYIGKIGWMKRIATGEAEPSSSNFGIVEISNDSIAHFLGKEMTRVQPPR